MNETSSNTISNVSNAIQSNTLFACLVLFIVLVLIVSFFIVVSKKGFIFDKSKGRVEFGGAKNDSNEEKQIPASTNTTEDKPTENNNIKNFDDIQFLKLISRIVDNSVALGYNKSVKRHSMYVTQMKYVYDSFERIKSDISVEYSAHIENADTYIINVIISSILHKCIYPKFESIYKEDRLTISSQEIFIENNRHSIEGFTTLIISELQNNYSKYDFFDLKELKSIIESKNDVIKKESFFCLNKAYERDIEYNKDLKLIENDLNSTIDSIIISSFNPHFNNSSGWDNSFPPNEVV